MEQAKKILGYVWAGVTIILAGAVFFLRASRDKALSKAAQAEADKKMATILTLKEEAEDEAIRKELEYKRVRDGFISQSDDDGSDPDSAA